MDHVFIMSSLFSPSRVEIRQSYDLNEILASEFYNVRPFAVFNKFIQFFSANNLSSLLLPTSTVFDHLTVKDSLHGSQN